MKKSIFILICILLISLVTSTYAVENTNSESKEVITSNEDSEKVLELTLQQAINYALTQNRDLKIQELNAKKEKVAYDERIHSIEDYNDYLDLPREEKKTEEFYYMTSDQKQLFELGVVERLAKLSLNSAKWNIEIKKNEIKYNVEKAYYDLSLSEEQMSIAKESLELAEKQYEQGKTMFELGTISKQQLLAIELGVSQAQSGYDAAKMAYELQKMNFNNTLGLPLDQDVVLLDKIEYKEHEELNLVESINEALENNVLLKVAEENHELAKLTLKAIEGRYPENTFKYRQQEVAVEEAAKSLEMAKNGVEMGVRNAYLNLVTAEKQIKTFEKAVEQAQQSLELTELSFELGQNTSNDVTQTRIEFMNAKKNLAEQIHAYNMALLDFQYSTGLGKTQIPSM